MKKKNKLILAGSIIVIAVATIVPSVLFTESKNYFNYTNQQETNLTSLYPKELSKSNLLVANNVENAQEQYNSLPTVNTPLTQILNGDFNLNNGNYIVIIGNQTDLAYQAISYSNFKNATTLSDYYSSYGSILYNALNTIGWNVPIYEYVQFPSFTSNQILNSQLTLYNTYEEYSPTITSSPTILDNLYINLIDYVKKIWSKSTDNETLVLAFRNGKANFWDQKAISSFLKSSSSDDSSDSSSTTSDSYSSVDTGALTDTVKNDILTSYDDLSTFFQKYFSNGTSTSSSSSSSSSSTSTSDEFVLSNLKEKIFLYSYNIVENKNISVIKNKK